jgi:spore maturation protein SpmB
VGIKNTRHAVGCCLFCDLIGTIAAFIIAHIFFG